MHCMYVTGIAIKFERNTTSIALVIGQISRGKASRVKFLISNATRVASVPNVYCYSMLILYGWKFLRYVIFAIFVDD